MAMSKSRRCERRYSSQTFVLEPSAPEGIGAARVHPNPIAPPGHIPAELQVIARGDPGAPDWHGDGLRLAEHAIPMHFASDYLGQVARIQGCGHVVENHPWRRLDQDAGELLAPLLGIVWGRTRSAARPVRIMAITSASSVLPVPWVVASNRASGTGPLMMWRQTDVTIAPTAFA